MITHIGAMIGAASCSIVIDFIGIFRLIGHQSRAVGFIEAGLRV